MHTTSDEVISVTVYHHYYIWVTLQMSKGRSFILHSAWWHTQTLKKKRIFQHSSICICTCKHWYDDLDILHSHLWT